MLKRFAFAAFLLVFTSLHAENSAIAVARAADDSKGYLVLSDGSFWKVHAFATRWRSFSEWINGVELPIPETYKCTLNDWIAGNEIEIAPKSGHLQVDLTNASNESDLRQCTHLFFNRRSEKILFAMPLDWTHGLAQVFDDGFHKGYDQGYEKGQSDGHSLGYAEGQSDAFRHPDDALDDDEPIVAMVEE